jgi:hypothetical protein
VLLKGTTVNGTGSNGLWLYDTNTIAVVANSIFSSHSFLDIASTGATLTSWGNNLSSLGGLSGGGDLINTDPKLAPLLTNYGEIPVFEPLPDSPARLSIPAANCGQPFDARGIPRPSGGSCSRGAAEPVVLFGDGFESP